MKVLLLNDVVELGADGLSIVQNSVPLVSPFWIELLLDQTKIIYIIIRHHRALLLQLARLVLSEKDLTRHRFLLLRLLWGFGLSHMGRVLDLAHWFELIC